jgi:hypothetical protein
MAAEMKSLRRMSGCTHFVYKKIRHNKRFKYSTSDEIHRKLTALTEETLPHSRIPF